MDEYVVYTLIALIAAIVLWRRTRSMYRPISGKGYRMLLPLLFVLPGIHLLLASIPSVPAWILGTAFGIGMVLSVPLIWTTNYEVREDKRIYTRKNWGFAAAFIAIVLLRFVLRHELAAFDPQSKIALLMLVAFGYIIPWRVMSFIKFRRAIHLSV